jgi:predicted ATPase with chaperone activity
MVALTPHTGAPGRSAANYLYCYLHGCPCGYAGDPTRECSCSASTIARYQKRLSGPLLDRIDIHVEVPRVEYEKLTDRREGERSAAVRVALMQATEVRPCPQLVKILISLRNGNHLLAEPKAAYSRTSPDSPEAPAPLLVGRK